MFNLFLRKFEKSLWKYLIFTLVSEAMKEKELLKTLAISPGFAITLSFTVKIFGISGELSLTLITDFTPFKYFWCCSN